jgi:glutamine amidotransferase
MRRTATVVDAGVGNLGNLARALEHLGARPEVTDDPERVRRSRVLLLPGVGAFRPPRERLRGALEDALRSALAQGACLLGICVGFQLLFESSSEFAETDRPTDGLGLLHGRVVELPRTVPWPHIGWNALHHLAAHRLLDGLSAGDCAYFVHGFAPEGVPADETLAACTHGRAFAAVAGRGRVLGAQFHPEKSGEVGLRLLRNFLELAAGGVAT